MQNRGSAFSLDHNHHNALCHEASNSVSPLTSGTSMKDGLAYNCLRQPGRRGAAAGSDRFHHTSRGPWARRASRRSKLRAVQPGRSRGYDANKLWLQQTAPDVVFATSRGRGHPVEPSWPAAYAHGNRPRDLLERSLVGLPGRRSRSAWGRHRSRLLGKADEPVRSARYGTFVIRQARRDPGLRRIKDQRIVAIEHFIGGSR